MPHQHQPQADAAELARVRALINELRNPAPPPLPDFNAERQAQAAAPGRPGYLGRFDLSKGTLVRSYTPLVNGVPCGETRVVTVQPDGSNDAHEVWLAVLDVAYRCAGADRSRFIMDLNTGWLERKSIGLR